MALTKIPANLLDKSAHVDFGDNERLRIGTGNDLQIYHSGSHSIITEGGTGDLRIDGDSVWIREADGTNQISAYQGTAKLYKDGTERIATTSTGASVTGNLAVSGNLTVSGTTTEISTTNLQVEDKNIVLNYGSGDTSSNADGAGITIQDAVDASNDATFNWSASNDRFVMSHGLQVTSGNVGIGTASPDSKVQIMNNDGSSYRFGYGGSSDVYLDADTVYFRTDNGGANTATLTTSGLGIGTTSVDSLLHTKATNNSAGDLYTQVGPGNAPGITIQNAGTTDNNNAALFFKNDSGTRASISAKFKDHSNDETDLIFSTTDTSGNARERIYLTANSQSGADFIGKEGPNALSTSAGDNWHLHADRAMTVLQDDNNASSWITMKSFRPSTNGRSLTIKWAAKNQSGSYWWRWRITRNGSVMKKSDQSTDAQGEYYEGLASGNSASVHAFRSFDVDVGEFHAGDLIKLEMINSNGSGTPVAGTQYLYAKQFEVLDLGYGKPQGTFFGVVREPAVWGSIHMTGSNGNQYTKGTMIIPFFLDAGTHNIVELAEYDQATTGVATMDYVGLYGYANRNMGQGRAMTSTRRRQSNADWEDIDGATVHSANGANGSITHPDFYWADGVLKVGVSSSVQITGTIIFSWHNATIQRHYQP